MCPSEMQPPTCKISVLVFARLLHWDSTSSYEFECDVPHQLTGDEICAEPACSRAAEKLSGKFTQAHGSKGFLPSESRFAAALGSRYL